MFSEIGLGALVVAWFGSLELRIRNHVGKDRFNDLKDQTCRIEDKVGRVEDKISRVENKVDKVIFHLGCEKDGN